jgi:6-phosphofructokinase 2
MQNIVTITINPAVDKSAVVDRIVPEHKLRCADVKYEPGGGGINVSRALKKLGAESAAVFTSGGPMGQLMEDLLRQEGVNPQPVPVQQWTRENFVVVDKSSNNQFRFGMPGPELSAREADAFLAILDKLPSRPDVVVGSGSLPPGVSTDFYARLAHKVKQIGAKYVLDTSGGALQQAVAEGVYLLKPNLGELSKLVGVESIRAEEVEEYARQVLSQGSSKVVVVSLGPAGAMLVAEKEAIYVSAPPVHKRSTVGAGDSMVAGMVYSLAQGRSLRETVQFGVACGSAATMNQGTELFRKPDVDRLYGWIQQNQSQERPATISQAGELS